MTDFTFQAYDDKGEMQNYLIDDAVVKNLLRNIDKGLVKGMGVPQPGEMCIEAAVCYSLGLPHGDNPACVHSDIRSLKITLNDLPWSSNRARAQGLRRLGVAQLGTRDHLDKNEFHERLVRLMVEKYIPITLRQLARKQEQQSIPAKGIDELRYAAMRCEMDGDGMSLINARDVLREYYKDITGYSIYQGIRACMAKYGTGHVVLGVVEAIDAYIETMDYQNRSAYYDTRLSDFAEDVVNILTWMDSPGKQWLHLTEEPSDEPYGK